MILKALFLAFLAYAAPGRSQIADSNKSEKKTKTPSDIGP
jgi:hypothetical protein